MIAEVISVGGDGKEGGDGGCGGEEGGDGGCGGDGGGDGGDGGCGGGDGGEGGEGGSGGGGVRATTAGERAHHHCTSLIYQLLPDDALSALYQGLYGISDKLRSRVGDYISFI